jgi:hypothetical protein
MNPAMVFKEGELWAVLGTPGADYQVQVNLQILTAMIDLGYDPQQAAEMPRWSSTQPGHEANWPHDVPRRAEPGGAFPGRRPRGARRARPSGRPAGRPRRSVLGGDHPTGAPFGTGPTDNLETFRLVEHASETAGRHQPG